MQKKLKDIATIRFGSYASPQTKGDIKYLFGKHFKDNDFSFEEQIYVNRNKIKEKDILQEGDILLAAKGHRNFVWTYDPKIGEAVAASIFFVIRPNSKLLTASYLTMLLQTSKYQNKLNTLGTAATNIASISKGDLNELKIPIPSLQKQHQLVKMHQLLEQEVNIMNKIIEKKQAIFNSALTQTLNQLK